MKSCKDLNIPLCNLCKMGVIDRCWTSFYIYLLGLLNKHSFKIFLTSFNNRDNEKNLIIETIVKDMFPQFIKTMNTFKLLK